MSEGRILVVEDDPKTAASLRLYLTNAGFDVDVAATGSAGLRRAREMEPDLLLLDVMLPEVDGLAVCRALRSESGVPVILLTARTTEDDKLRGLGLGADDYVTKPFSPREVVARVKAVLRRTRRGVESRKTDTALKHRDLEMDLAAHVVTRSGHAVALTPTEFRLLEVLLRHPRRAFSRAQLAERVFGRGSETLDRTVDAHVMKLRRKIEPRPARPSYVVTVFGVGYALGEAGGE